MLSQTNNRFMFYLLTIILVVIFLIGEILFNFFVNNETYLLKLTFKSRPGTVPSSQYEKRIDFLRYKCDLKIKMGANSNDILKFKGKIFDFEIKLLIFIN
jgi:hypothetical protein